MRMTRWESYHYRLDPSNEQVFLSTTTPTVEKTKQEARYLFGSSLYQQASYRPNYWGFQSVEEVRDKPALICRLKPIETYMTQGVQSIDLHQRAAREFREMLDDANWTLFLLEVIGTSAISGAAARLVTWAAKSITASSWGARFLSGAEIATKAKSATRLARLSAKIWEHRLAVQRVTKWTVETMVFDEWEETLGDIFGETFSAKVKVKHVGKYFAILGAAFKLYQGHGVYQKRMGSVAGAPSYQSKVVSRGSFDDDLKGARSALEQDICRLGMQNATGLWLGIQNEYPKVKQWAEQTSQRTFDTYNPGWLAKCVGKGDSLRTLAKETVYHLVLADYWHHVVETMFDLWGSTAAVCLRIRQVSPDDVKKAIGD